MKIDKLIRKIAFELDKDQIPYMVIGGQAVLACGIVRNTLDIDITLGVDAGQLQRVKDICDRTSLKILVANLEEYVSVHNCFSAEDSSSGMRIDFIFSFTPYERQAMERTKKISIEGYNIGFASTEDVIIHKAFAGRAIDLEDVKNILVKNPKLDFAYIKKWLKEFNEIPECTGVLERFEMILEDVQE